MAEHLGVFHRISLLAAFKSMISGCIALSLVLLALGAVDSLSSWKNSAAVRQKRTSKFSRRFDAPQTHLFCQGGETVQEDDGNSAAIYDDLRNKLKGTSIYLIGLMGSGKSSVGEGVAKGLGYRFLDTDEIAEFMCEMSIADYFASETGGEANFRELEYKILMELGQYTRTVVSTGGGIVVKQENWGLRHHGIVVFLDMQPTDIINRLQSGESSASEIQKRPLLKDGDPLAMLETLRRDRIEQYSEADITIPITADITKAGAAELVAREVINFIERNPPTLQKRKTEKELKAKQSVEMVNPQLIPESERKNGSIKYVNLSDIESGKVSLKSDEEKRR